MDDLPLATLNLKDFADLAEYEGLTIIQAAPTANWPGRSLCNSPGKSVRFGRWRLPAYER